MIDATPLIAPILGNLYQALAPWAEALLRAIVGLALVPHGLRMAFGFFPETGGPIRNLSMMAEALDRWGYRPGRLWAPLIAATQLIAGPLLALGLLFWGERSESLCKGRPMRSYSPAGIGRLFESGFRPPVHGEKVLRQRDFTRGAGHSLHSAAPESAGRRNPFTVLIPAPRPDDRLSSPHGKFNIPR